eukprot:1158748-Pelagomonas_calceolata.AAC.7
MTAGPPHHPPGSWQTRLASARHMSDSEDQQARNAVDLKSWTRHTCWTEPMPCSAAVKLASKPCAIGQQPRQWIAENGHTRISNS